LEQNRNDDSENPAMHLRRRIELYLRRNRMAPTRFGREAMGDPRFVFDLRNGRELRENTVSRVASWLDSREATQ
jgi:hypothetical protein